MKGRCFTARPDKNGNTALIILCNEWTNNQVNPNTLSLVQLLIRYGADPSIVNNKQQSALMLAQQSGGKTEVINFLLVHQEQQKLQELLVSQSNDKREFDSLFP